MNETVAPGSLSREAELRAQIAQVKEEAEEAGKTHMVYQHMYDRLYNAQVCPSCARCCPVGLR